MAHNFQSARRVKLAPRKQSRRKQTTRRDFLRSVSAAAISGSVLAGSTRVLAGVGPLSAAADSRFRSPSDRPVVGCIGTGSRWHDVGPAAADFADCAALCDVDANHLAEAKQFMHDKQGTDKKIDVYEDYRKILERNDIDLITIVTPDHWHTKIAVEALKAGKDVYCEKPLTLTIEEGKLICKTTKETGRVFQVGTQQRSEMGLLFLQALALIADGRIGKIEKVTCGIDGAPRCRPIPLAPVPSGLNWDLWLGQAPKVEFRYRHDESGLNSRCHYEFRWWYEYSGGKMTDWGAHHVDIGTWGICINQGVDMSKFGPLSVAGSAEHPCDFKDGYPTRDDMYNTAHKFNVSAHLPGGVEVIITSEGRNGVLFEGDKGRFFVSRDTIVGAPVEALAQNPLPTDAVKKIYGGKQPGNHMQNFMECVKSRELPISDVFTHHRALTICHLANIAIRLQRELKWDADTEQVVGDESANAWQSREVRKGFEIES